MDEMEGVFPEGIWYILYSFWLATHKLS